MINHSKWQPGLHLNVQHSLTPTDKINVRTDLYPLPYETLDMVRINGGPPLPDIGLLSPNGQHLATPPSRVPLTGRRGESSSKEEDPPIIAETQ